MPSKGIPQVRAQLKRTFSNIAESKAPAAVMAAISIGMAYTSVKVPMDTGTLINSQFRAVEKVGTIWRGRAGFTAEYAAAVHSMPGKLKGQPRSSVNSFETSTGSVGFASNSGNFWDPQGEPQFLEKGFSEARQDIDRVVRAEMKL